MKQTISSEQSYHILISSKEEDPTWDTFVDQAPSGHHVQTSMWAQVKSSLGWEAARIAIWREERIIGGLQILIRSLPLVGKIGYISKGPVLVAQDEAIAQELIAKLHSFAKDQSIKILIAQPPNHGDFFVEQLLQSGFRPSNFEVIPIATTMIDLSLDIDDILAKMKSKTRYNIRLGFRKGITVREGQAGDLAIFYKTLVATSERQEFNEYSEAYFEKMRDSLAPHGYFKLFVAEYEGEPMSTLLVIPFGDTVTFKKGGWSGRNGKLHPNECMHWSAIQWAKSQGFRYYDFEGIKCEITADLLSGNAPSNEVMNSADGKSRFKLGFGGRVQVNPGTFQYAYNPILRWSLNRFHTMLVKWSATEALVKRFKFLSS